MDVLKARGNLTKMLINPGFLVGQASLRGSQHFDTGIPRCPFNGAQNTRAAVSAASGVGALHSIEVKTELCASCKYMI